MKNYFKCSCGSETFVKVYNVWNEKIKVEITKEDGYEFWDIEEHGKEKDSLMGYICANCRQDAPELNNNL